MNDEIPAKIVIVGLAAAGKSSILRQFFNQWNITTLQKISPTVLIDMNQYKLPHIKKNIVVWDLGGQKAFIKSHLQRKSLFKTAHAVIFVVDISKKELFNDAVRYFSEILQLLEERDHPQPKKFLFFHKFDPEKAFELSFTLPMAVNTFLPLLGRETTYFVTSIYSDTAVKAMLYVLADLFPELMFQLSLEEELVTSLYEELLNNENLQQKIKQLSHNALLSKITAGFRLIGYNLVDVEKIKWLSEISSMAKSPVKNEDSSQKKKNFCKAILKKDEVLELNIKCPLLQNKEMLNTLLPSVEPHILCQITRSLLNGICENLKLDYAQQVQTMLLDDSELCKFYVRLQK